jgi:hypothetical protein
MIVDFVRHRQGSNTREKYAMNKANRKKFEFSSYVTYNPVERITGQIIQLAKTLDAIYFNDEFDLNKIDEKESQYAKHDDPRISILQEISI